MTDLSDRDLGNGHYRCTCGITTDATDGLCMLCRKTPVGVPIQRNQTPSPSYRRGQLARSLRRWRDGKISARALADTVAWFLENGA